MLQGKLSAILSSFIQLPFVIKIFVLSIFEWLFYTGFTVTICEINSLCIGTLSWTCIFKRNTKSTVYGISKSNAVALYKLALLAIKRFAASLTRGSTVSLSKTLDHLLSTCST